MAADHGGYALKEQLAAELHGAGYQVVDFGDHRLEAQDDYPDFVVPLARAVAAGRVDRGVAVCGSGVGACVAANKVAGARACLIHENFSARQGVEDDDLNVICLGGLVVGREAAWGLVQTFLAARFSGAERHRRRLAKVAALEGSDSLMTARQLFQPFGLKSLHLRNRIVMAPMTRSFSPGGVPTAKVADYYDRRVAGEVGLIISEGTVVNRPAASNDPDIPHFYGAEPLLGWKAVIDLVHRDGGTMAPQLWHMGVVAPKATGWLPAAPFEGPSGLVAPGKMGGVAMSALDIADTVSAFAQAAGEARRLGFDAVEIHGAHGYLIDQFFWGPTNQRTDAYGGKTLAERTRFAVEVIEAVRGATGPDFPICLRLSQWKLQDYGARLAATPREMEAWLDPLVRAGVDIFHCSQRRFWEPEFPDSDLNFAGWAKQLTGKPTITVGSVGLSGDFLGAFAGEASTPRSLAELLRRFDRGDFDLVAVGRALLADADWAQKIEEGRSSELRGFTREALATLT
jgi:RpiB/LacA/LacB family sugar-phosphate isomerase